MTPGELAILREALDMLERELRARDVEGRMSRHAHVALVAARSMARREEDRARRDAPARKTG